MKSSFPTTLIFFAIASVLTTACLGSPVAPTQQIPETVSSPPQINITNTPDPCAPENIQAEIQKVHNFMREFDDGSSLAASLPVDQLPDAIANLQRIRRDAENQVTPSCLASLKNYQISHMNVVIGTLLNLIGYANGSVEKQVIDQGIALAREQHDKYTTELARLLGITMVPADVAPAITQSP